MSENVSKDAGIMRDISASVIVGLGLCVLGWLAISAWTWIFGIDPNSESWYASLASWGMILFGWNAAVQGVLWGCGDELKKIGAKIASDYNRVFVCSVIVAVVVYIAYIIMMVLEVKEYNAAHVERHGFYLTMQIITAIVFFLICFRCSVGMALSKKDAEKSK